MVSMNPTSPEGFHINTNGAALPGNNSFTSPSANAAVTPPSPSDYSNNKKNRKPPPMDDSNSMKIRKPYTITRSRESWSEPEHDKFLEALQLFDRDWKKIEAFIGSKTVIQIRSHAQKYFLKVQKSGSNEHLPPPRPKRKAAHPYPQKAPKAVPPANGPLQASLLEPGVQRPEPASMPSFPNNPAVLLSLATNTETAGAPSTAQGDAKSSGPPVANNCTSSTESIAMTHAAGDVNEAMKHSPPLRVLPDFAQVYRFIGSVFDPKVGGHLQRLKQMDPIDVETVLLLVRNLSINLTSPDFEDHRKLLSSYDIDSDNLNRVA